MISALAGGQRISRGTPIKQNVLLNDLSFGDQRCKTPRLLPGSGRRGNQNYETKRRRIKPAMPTSPVPSKPSVPGSGTVGGVTGVEDVVKQVAKPPVVGSV